MRADDADFIEALEAVLNGTADEAQRRLLDACLREDPVCRKNYGEQVEFDLLLRLSYPEKATTEATEAQRDVGGWNVGSRQSAVGGTWRSVWWKVAAAAALAIAAVTVWQTMTASGSEEAGVRSGNRLDSDLRSLASGPVELVREAGAVGLELPGTLPGAVRMEEGLAVVRLASGVELTLQGPLELDVRDTMLVRLSWGRLLARVPSVASGFTVRTRELELWDVGTVFGVSAGEGDSDVFVFKGEVQVNEASGEPVDLCGAGEGVRAKGDGTPVKYEVHGEEGRKLFEQVKGCAALKNPDRAWQATLEIEALWANRYGLQSNLAAENMPKGNRINSHGKPQGRAAVAAVQKTGGANAASHQEEESMTTKSTLIGALAAGVVAAASTQAAELFYSATVTGPGYYPWDDVAGWVIYNSGGTLYGQLPTINDNVRINATTPKAENGNALTVTNGVFAECNLFATGDQNYPGTAWFRLDGGSLTCATHFITGRYYPGLATLESGTLYGGDLFSIGSGSIGTVTNEGATVNFNRIGFGTDATASGTLVQNGGSITGRTEILIGRKGYGLATLNGGTLSAGSDFYIGHEAGGNGTLTNNGAAVEADQIVLANQTSASPSVLVQNGGSLTARTDLTIGYRSEALAELNGGVLSISGTGFVGRVSGSIGTLTNTGAAVTAGHIFLGFGSTTSGRLVHSGGSLNTGGFLSVGRNGGLGVFEASAPFSARLFLVGAGLAPTVPGTGTVTLAEGAVGDVGEYLRINNGDLFLRGGQIHLRNVGNPNRTNLFVRTGADRRGQLCGWGYVGYTNENITLRMLNNGQVVADGEGVERDLDFNMIAVVNNDIPNGASDTNGWYAVNKGRLLFPRSMSTVYPANTPTAVCSGDLASKTLPEMVNSIGLTMTYSTAQSSGARAIRGGICAPDRSDIPSGLPTHLRPIGVWFVGSFNNSKLAPSPATFSNATATFRYDHTKLKPTDSSLRLYRYDGSVWVQVGSCLPGGSPLISTAAPLAPVASGDYNIGWFAAMALERKGTVISVH